MTDETGGKPTLATLLSSGYGGTLAKLMEADADHVTIPTDALTELLAAAEECADRAERNARAKCWASTGATIYRQAFANDMAPVDRLRAAVARVRGE